LGASRVRDRFEQAQAAELHTHLRDEIDGLSAPPWRPGSARSRRARADANQPARRDDGFEMKGQHHLDQRPRTAPTSATRRCCAGPLRSSDRGRTVRPRGSRKIREVTREASRSRGRSTVDVLRGQTPGFNGADPLEPPRQTRRRCSPPGKGKRDIAQDSSRKGSCE